MRGRKRWMKWGLGIGGMAMLATLLFCIFPRERLLLPQSTLVADMSGWGEGRRFYNSIGIHWLSDDSLLYNRFINIGDSNHPNGNRIIYRRNVRTGVDEKLPGLTAAREDFETEVVDSQNVSPDGHWYVCSESLGRLPAGRGQWPPFLSLSLPLQRLLPTDLVDAG
jgi:hypothetical protein